MEGGFIKKPYKHSPSIGQLKSETKKNKTKTDPQPKEI